MTDVFEEWKKSKFITASADLLDFADEQLVILTDYNYWLTCEDELDAWCEQHGANHQGMTVTFPDQKTLMLFCLTWS